MWDTGGRSLVVNDYSMHRIRINFFHAIRTILLLLAPAWARVQLLKQTKNAWWMQHSERPGGMVETLRGGRASVQRTGRVIIYIGTVSFPFLLVSMLYRRRWLIRSLFNRAEGIFLWRLLPSTIAHIEIPMIQHRFQRFLSYWHSLVFDLKVNII